MSFTEITLPSPLPFDDCKFVVAMHESNELTSPPKSTFRRENALNRMRLGHRLLRAVLCFVAVLFLCCPADQLTAQDASVTSAELLPPNTTGWVSVPDVRALKKAIENTQLGAMMRDPNVKPFIEDLTKQVRGYLDKQNIRFGLTLEDIEKVQSGEICLAGVLRKSAGLGEDGVTDHAIVLLVDVGASRQEAAELLEQIGEELTARGATEEKIDLNGIECSKWAFKKPQGLRQKQFAYHALVGDWLIATDNEGTFRDIVNRVEEPSEDRTVLAKTEAFAAIQAKCNFEKEGYSTHLRWFIEPFGYVQLAQAIADAQNSGEGKRNNIAKKFKEEGFSAIQGLGGSVAVATNDHEVVHRSFIFAPAVTEDDDRYKLAAAMLDFRNDEKSPLNPPVWVPENAGGYLTLTWDLDKALDRVGSIIDKTAGVEGSFRKALKSIKIDPKGPQVDIPALVNKLHDRITICSITQTPIDDESERIVFGVQLKDLEDEEFISESIFRLYKNDAEVVDFNGKRILVVDTASAVRNLDYEDDFDDEFGDDDFGGDPLADEEVETEEDIAPAKPLFEKQVFVVGGGFLLVGNNLDQIKTILELLPEKQGEGLAKAADYLRVKAALEALAGDEPPSLRQFGRMDRTLQTNYEMLRTNRMPQSKTLLGQLVNRAYSNDDTPEGFVRPQELDGSKMPEDYEGQVAKYFGPAGQVVHSLEDGWLVTGLILKKSNAEAELESGNSQELVSGN